jgi:hypothetical protein
MKIAISTTVKNLDPSFNTWVQYHLALVDQLFIFCDNHGELQLPFLPKGSNIQYFPGSQTQVYDSPIDNNMVRQDENIRQTVAACLDMGIDWLIHIDLDELMCATRLELEVLFGNPAVGQVLFTNHEAIPVWESDNVFEDCRYFKVNGQHAGWDNDPWFFLAYVNGKGAGRIHPELCSVGPHQFGNIQGETLKYLPKPFVLHYPNSTFELWKRKYENLGVFGDFWFSDPNKPNTITFYMASRDVYQHCMQTGDFSKAESFFSRLIPLPEMIEQLVAQGVLMKLEPLRKLKPHG